MSYDISVSKLIRFYITQVYPDKVLLSLGVLDIYVENDREK